MNSTFVLSSFGLGQQMLSRQDVLVLDVIGALLVHQLYKRYEVDPSRLGLTLLLLGFIPSLSASSLLFSQSEAGVASLSAILLAFSTFYAALIGSVIVYRLSPFHPLAKYPGPVLARVTKLYGLKKMATGKSHLWYKQLHTQYGPYVRVGPNEVSCIDVGAITTILGPNGLPKGPLWDARRNPRFSTRSIIAIRDPHEHARRRKPWNRAFNTASLKAYEPTLVKRALQLAGELEKRARQDEKAPVDLAQWMKCFTFDFMGDMAFSESFQTMGEGRDNIGIWHALEGGMKAMSLIQHVPWTLELLDKLHTGKSLELMRKFSLAAVAKRKQEGSHSSDIFHHLIDEDGVEKTRPTEMEVLSDATTTVVAGSDTTAVVLSGLFYNLLQFPEDYKHLQQEVDQTFPRGGGDAIDVSKLSEMVFLNAVINEALRFNPAADAIQRGTTAVTGGRYFGDNYIPEGTAIGIPIYTLLRDPRYFSPAPEAFWPDRWLAPSMRKRSPAASSEASEEKETLNLSAFIPFSYGSANCAGKSLALMEMRMVVALLMQRFEMRLDEGYDLQEWGEKYEDWFVFSIGRLPVVLRNRK